MRGRCPGAGRCCSAPGTRPGRSTSTPAEDEHAVQRLAAQGADEAFADRVHPRRLDSAAQNSGPGGGLEYGVERARKVRSAVADQESHFPEPLAWAKGEVAGLLHRPLAGRAGGDADQAHPAVPCSMNTRTYSRRRSTVSTCRKSTARIPATWAFRNCRQVGPDWRGAGSMPAARRISCTSGRRDRHSEFRQLTVDPTVSPRRGISLASRTTRRAMLRTIGGRPGMRRLLVSYFSRRQLTVPGQERC